MKNYTKAVLYAYPFLKNIGKEYDEHVFNRAILSYRSDFSAERIALYIAGEIVEKQTLQQVEKTVDEVLSKLSDVERTLVAIRYFGKQRKIRRALTSGEKGGWSERTYFRMQRRLSEKLGALLAAKGIDERYFQEELLKIELFEKTYRFVCEGKDRQVRWNEREWLAGQEQENYGSSS